MTHGKYARVIFLQKPVGVQPVCGGCHPCLGGKSCWELRGLEIKESTDATWTDTSPGVSWNMWPPIKKYRFFQWKKWFQRNVLGVWLISDCPVCRQTYLFVYVYYTCIYIYISMYIITTLQTYMSRVYVFNKDTPVPFVVLVWLI